MEKRTADHDAWSWLTTTWVGPVLSLIALISSPLMFVEERGWAVAIGIATLATWFWWITVILLPQKPQTLFDPGGRVFTIGQTILRLLVPLSVTAILFYVVFVDVSKLDIWRREFKQATLSYHRQGPVSQVFDEAALRDTPSEREDYDRVAWIRWVGKGAKQDNPSSDLLFIETDPFDHKYHTFEIDVHDLNKQIKPTNQSAAFLVGDKSTIAGTRRYLRQIRCDFSSDANSRLYRVRVDNPEPGEFLWLFLGVRPSGVGSNSLNSQPQLMVRQ
jgi:hypothetical protein